ncbi:hypothetical protein LSH36_174g06048 [Paralvinella palmiformis]|uniref:Uncharacterized protein n=1 Tax=Paralvinella palmiformis TaxID=53620 RepID=A0AAD9JS98_9ANNE|nr:hypothetical protein LSH36_174g06048 [Paralvinella palmiformis]
MSRSRLPSILFQGLANPRQIRAVMSSLSPDMQVVARVRKKFQKLEETCMERYQAREHRVISTLDFCMTALEQLQKWALFAIFPLDEQNSDKYLAFVEQRFRCVVNPLRLFLNALHREQSPTGVGPGIPLANGRKSPRSPRTSLEQSLRDSGRGSPIFGEFRLDRPREWPEKNQPTACASARDSQALSNSFNASGSSSGGSASGSSHDSGLFLTSAASDHGSNGNNVGKQRETPLRDRISSMSAQYIEEGESVRRSVAGKLEKCRRDMRIIYRWGQASLVDLNDVLDDSLSDELYFLVRGKMQRILSDLSAFEEAADQIDKNLSHYFQSQSKERPPNGLDIDNPEFVIDFPKDLLGGASSSLSRHSPRFESFDLRLDLEDVEEVGNPITPRFTATAGKDDVTDSGESTRGSTPEPPTSPRPKGLVNHPKIMKDKLQSYALPRVILKSTFLVHLSVFFFQSHSNNLVSDFELHVNLYQRPLALKYHEVFDGRALNGSDL